MAKPKHPTVKSLRQGQTIHFVGLDPYKDRYTVESYRLHSTKTPIPPQGERFERMPVDWARKNMDWFLPYVFYSRRKAYSFCRQLNRSHTTIRHQGETYQFKGRASL